jgi:hypothetical protein
MSLDDHAAFIASIDESPFAQLTGPGMVLLSLLSDAQDLLDRGNPATAAALIDRAKAVIIHYKLGLKV